MFNSQEAVDRLIEIESSGEIDQLVYASENVWPLLRRALWFLYVKGEKPRKHFRFWNTSGRLKAALKRSYEALELSMAEEAAEIRDTHELADPGRPHRILFASYPTVAGVETKDGLYDTRVDPYLEWARDRGIETQKTLIRPADNNSSHQGWVHPPSSVIPGELVRLDKSYARVRSREQSGRQLSHQLVEIGKRFEEVRLFTAEHLLQGFSCRRYFRNLLLKQCPTAVFVTFFYNPMCMALIAAAQSLSIPVVDLQHGKQGIQGMYYGWSRIPENGFATLPNFYWMWGQTAADSILAKMPDSSPHRPVVGGNLWLEKFQDNPQRFEPSEISEFRKRCNSFRQVVLVSLQHTSSIPTLVQQAMRHGAPDRLWLIRCHPVVRKKSRTQICQQINEAGANEEFDIHSASDYPLFSLLDLSTHHVTEWSSVCYEADAFDVPTTFVHEEANIHFQPSIQRDVFHSVNSVQQLIHSFDSPPSNVGQSNFFQPSISCDGILEEELFS